MEKRIGNLLIVLVFTGSSLFGQIQIEMTEEMEDMYPTFEKAHPKAQILMKDPFYFNTTDETAPFGNDDGADTYAGFNEWRSAHPSEDPAAFLFERLNAWGYPKFDIYETDINKLIPYLKAGNLNFRFMSGTDAAIIAIAFGQLYLEGTIDKGFKEIALFAITRQLIPEILDRWGDEYQAERKEKLTKMSDALSQIN